MKKFEMDSFIPRRVQKRTSFFDLGANLFNYEACYQDEQLQLREQILSHRDAAHFDKDLLLTDSSWFSSDRQTAFENVNQGSYLLSSRLKPRQRLKEKDFRAEDYGYGIFKWDSIVVVEKYIADFLLTRNLVISQSQPEHLNDPMNFFFLDVKRIIRTIAREQNPEMVLKASEALLNYIGHVETELSFNDQDRVFIEQLRNLINKNIKPSIQEQIEKANIRSHIEKLIRELDSVIETSNSVTHFSFQDTAVNPHPSVLASGKEYSNRVYFPTAALLNCANKVLEEKSSSSVKPFDSAALIALKESPFYSPDQGQLKLKPNIDLLNYCQDIRLMAGLTTEDKENYIASVSHIHNLLEFKFALQQIIFLLDEAGQYQVIIAFSYDLQRLLQALQKEIQKTRIDIEEVLNSNQQMKQKLLKHTLVEESSGYFHALLKKLGLAYSEYNDINIAQFILNQDHRHLLSTKDNDERYQRTSSSTEKLMDMLTEVNHNYRTTNNEKKLSSFGFEVREQIKRLVENVEDFYLDEAETRLQGDVVEQEAPKSQAEAYQSNCKAVYDKGVNSAALYCQGQGHRILVYPKGKIPSDEIINYQADDYYRYPRIEQDTYQLSSCRAVNFHGLDSIVCDGEKTSMFYQPSDSIHAPIHFFSSLYGQVALSLVFYQVAKGVYQWFFSPKRDSNILVSQKEGKYFIQSAYKTISTIKSKNDEDQDWVNGMIDDHLIDLERLKRLNNRKKLTRDEVDALQQRLEFSLASVTKVDESEVIQAQKRAYTKLQKKVSLSEPDLVTVMEYLIKISCQLNNEEVSVEPELYQKFRAVQAKTNHSIKSLITIAESVLEINQLAEKDEPVMKSDVEQVFYNIGTLKTDNTLQAEGTLANDISALRNHRHSLLHMFSFRRNRIEKFINAPFVPCPSQIFSSTSMQQEQSGVQARLTL